MIHRLVEIFFSVNALVLSIAVARQIERRWPIADNAASDIISDWKVISVNLALAMLLEPVAGICSAAIVGWMGGGFIHLRTDTWWWYGLSLASLIVAVDFYKYWYHRLEHAVPFLWEMHSLHHSAEALTFATGGRHYWLERVLAGAFLPILPIVFTIPTGMMSAVALAFILPESCAHLNVRFPLGPAVTWVNNPQWHRIHHSVLPEHYDKNFTALFPLWDILFGTAWIPHPDEYPATGIDPSEKVSVIDSIVWPFRRHLRRLSQRARHDRSGSLQTYSRRWS